MRTNSSGRLAVVFALMLMPAAASADTVELAGTSVSFAGTNADNVVVVDTDAALDQLRFTDFTAGQSVTGSSGCTSNSGRAYCSVVEVTSILMGFQGGNDQLGAASIQGASMLVNGGAGNDTLATGAGPDYLSGASGNDTLSGGPGDDVFGDTFTFLFGSDPGTGNDTFNGQGGSDTFTTGVDATTDGAGIGQDTFSGGSGVDTADYSLRTAPLTITVGAAGGDGAAGELDAILDAERVLGGSASDVIVGGGEASTLAGGAGADTLTGGAAADVLFGGTLADGAGSGDDTLDGGGGGDILRGGDGVDTASYAGRSAPVGVTLDDAVGDGTAGEGDNVRTDVERVVGGTGADTLIGSDGRDTLEGGLGADTIDGGDGADVLHGDDGADVIVARDGQVDAVVCGAGDDTVSADAADGVAADCEHVDRPLLPGAAPATVTEVVAPAGGSPAVIIGGPTAPSALPLVIQTLGLVAGKRGRLAVKLQCPPQAAACAGTLVLRDAKKPKRALATKPFNVPAGSARTIRFTLPAKQRLALTRRALRLVLAATATGATTTAQATVARKR